MTAEIAEALEEVGISPICEHCERSIEWDGAIWDADPGDGEGSWEVCLPNHTHSPFLPEELT